MTDSVASECGESNGLLQVIATGGAGGFTYQWDNGENGPLNSNIDAGNYQVTVTDNSGCNLSDILDLACKQMIPIVPNGFISVNDDGKNDTWILDNLEFYPDCKVTVYNRWGTMVYQSQPYTNNWKGYYTEGGAVSGPLPAATYFYVIDTMKKSQDPIKGYLEIQH
jgi:gliding motility-associated-like protein